MPRILVSILLLGLSSLSWAGQQAPVKVHIQWDYRDFQPPIVLYEVKGHARLWDTQTAPSLAKAPVGNRIANVLSVAPGENRRFVLVVHNTGGKPLHFFAAPHVVHPAEHSLGFKFKCLCVDHAFTVAPGQFWYRVVEFRLSKDFVGAELDIKHSIIGIDQKRADSFSKKSATPDL